MSLTSIEEYLTKELVIEHNVVTFRLLSRTQGIHVNKAKKELQAFYETARTQPNNTLEATYLVSGETLPWHAPRYHSHFVNQDKEDEMEIDEKEDESIPRFEMIVTPEKHLEAVKGRFTKISAIHIYSLSPSRIIDPTFLVPPTETVRQIDQSKGEALARKVGRVVAPPIKGAPKHSKPVLGKTAPVAAIKQGTTSQKASPAPDKPVKTEEVTKSAPPAKSKAQSSLNWSKAKKPEPKETAPAPQVKVEEVATLEEDRNSKPAEEVPVKAVPVKEPLKEVKAQKVRTKSPTPPRKASPQPNPPPKPDAAGPRIRKGRVVSDSEDEVPVPKRGKKRKSDILSKESDTERSLRAMMDIDDEYVTKASSTSKNGSSEKKKTGPASEVEDTEPERDQTEEAAQQTEEEDHSMQVDEEQPVYPKAPRKKKEKKEIPIGRNGLKKKRVIKTRKEKNKKGYTVNVDYSSYESVDEEEPEPAPVKKPRKSGTKVQVKAETPASGSDAELKPPKPKPKAVARAGSKQSLLGFFEKK